MKDGETEDSQKPDEPPSPRELFRRYGKFSMMARRRFVANLKLARAVTLDMSRHSVVETGVWRGGASFAMLDLFPQCPEFHLFDSFEGLPEPTARDGQRANQFSNENLFVEGRNYASFEEVEQSISEFGFGARTTVHKGWFEDTVGVHKIERPIGILRLDGDWYDSTKVVLDRLFDVVAPDGLIIVDDYFDWPGCSQAVHDALSERAAPECLRTFDNLVAYIKKKPADFLSMGPTKNELAKRRRSNSSAVK